MIYDVYHMCLHFVIVLYIVYLFKINQNLEKFIFLFFSKYAKSFLWRKLILKFGSHFRGTPTSFPLSAFDQICGFDVAVIDVLDCIHLSDGGEEVSGANSTRVFLSTFWAESVWRRLCTYQVTIILFSTGSFSLKGPNLTKCQLPTLGSPKQMITIKLNILLVTYYKSKSYWLNTLKWINEKLKAYIIDSKKSCGCPKVS